MDDEPSYGSTRRDRIDGATRGSDAPRRRLPCCRWPSSPSRGPRAWPRPGSDTASAGSDTLPDGSQVPAQAVRVPASLTAPHTLTPGVRGHVSDVVSTASASGIPAVALAAYQRAATVIDAADHELPPAVAAGRRDRPGRVRPRPHGRQRAHRPGIAKPGIFGPALDGTHGTTVDPRHRRRPVRRGRALRPRGRADAVHPVDLGDRRGRRRQRRPAQPPGHLRRLARLGGLPLLGHRRPRHRGRRALGGPPLQPQPALRRPGAGHHARLPGRRLQLGAERYDDDRLQLRHPACDHGRRRSPPPPPRREHHGPHHTRHHGPATTTPTSGPTSTPTSGPTSGPTANPTAAPTGGLPTKLPLPTSLPTLLPTDAPTLLTHGPGGRAVPGRGAGRQPARPGRRLRPLCLRPDPLRSRAHDSEWVGRSRVRRFGDGDSAVGDRGDLDRRRRRPHHLAAAPTSGQLSPPLSTNQRDSRRAASAAQ